MSELPRLEIEKIKNHLDFRDFRLLRQTMKEADSADIAEVFAQFDLESCVILFRLIPSDKRADVFSHLEFGRQEELLQELPDVVVTSVVNEMEPDDRTRLLEELPFEIRSQIMLKLSPEERKMAWQLLSYPEDSVGRLMTPEFLVLRAEMQVREALDLLRWSPSLPEDQLHNLFVADEEGKYLGDLSLAALVVTDPPTRPVGDIMKTNAIAINANEDQEVAVDFFRKYDRSYLPVVDDDSVLLGIVTADDVFDVAEEEATEDIQQFGGQSNLEEGYFASSLVTLFQKRAGWLAIMFVGGVLTAAALQHYEEMTATMTWLAVFFPLIISSGGNTGSQAAAMVIRGIAVREMEDSDWTRVFFREASVGFGLGTVLAVLGFLLAVFVWNLGVLIGGVVALSLLGVVLFGGVVGAMLPFLFQRLRLDPAVSSSPLLASLVDIFGVLIFYNVARYIVMTWGP